MSKRERDRLDGIVCAITGGAQGIGFATATELAKIGGNIAIVDLDLRTAEDDARSLSVKFGVNAAGFAADVSDEAAVDAAMRAIEYALGAPGVLVNNAGIMTPRLAFVRDMPAADFDRMLAIHVRGAFLFSKAAIPGMERAGFGRIVNISSVLGLVGLPSRIGYAAAKTAIVGLTRSLAMEVARKGITANAVAPGYILTDTLKKRLAAGQLDYDLYAERTPVGRWGLPEEIGRLIAFLAQPGSGFINGAIVPIDGGYTVRGDPGENLGERTATMTDVERLFGLGQ